MIKGCAKRVVVVRDVENPLFEEAFFIVRPYGEKRTKGEAELLAEARKFLQNHTQSGQNSLPHGVWDMHKYPIPLQSPVKRPFAAHKFSLPPRFLRDTVMVTLGFVLCLFLFALGRGMGWL